MLERHQTAKMESTNIFAYKLPTPEINEVICAHSRNLTNKFAWEGKF